MVFSIASLTFFCMFSVAVAMMWSSQYGKIWQIDRVLNKANWVGNEHVLDIGCGRGLMLIAAAKRLNALGRGFGVDIWSKNKSSDHAMHALYKNLEQEGVVDKVEVLHADPRALPFKDEFFDVVICNLVLHNFMTEYDREQVLHEMLRVIKPRGYIVIQDIFYTHEYHAYLQKKKLLQLDISNLQWFIFPPARIIVARKL